MKIINSIKLESRNNGTQFLVPATVDGMDLKFVLDSGAGITTLSRNVAKELSLSEIPSGIFMKNVTGDGSNTKVTAKSIDIGAQHGSDFTFQIDPNSSLSGIAGLLSTDLFQKYGDVDLDFGAARLNVFSNDHCEGKVTYWPERPIAVIPLSLKNGHLIIQVTVDGVPLNAVIDTGATDTILSATTAEYDMKFSLGSAETPQIDVSKEDPQLKLYSHDFKLLSFEGVTVSNPKIIIMTDRMGSKMIHYGNVRIPKLPDLVIGMNVLKLLHIYIAYGEKKLYISPGGTGESVLFKTAAAPAK
ncbi:MAG: pepsin/retropepsin-like aspartic protease family protein [Rhizomicrobium sp.]